MARSAFPTRGPPKSVEIAAKMVASPVAAGRHRNMLRSVNGVRVRFVPGSSIIRT
jgi:hypothetical protein